MLPSGPAFLVILGIAFSIYAGEEVGKGLHKVGCKLHFAHSHCEKVVK
jgi:hypothetical protein